MATRSSTSKEAAAILRRLLEVLPLPAAVAAYVRGYADGLERRGGTRPDSR
jgi:hypothetical protein